MKKIKAILTPCCERLEYALKRKAVIITDEHKLQLRGGDFRIARPGGKVENFREGTEHLFCIYCEQRIVVQMISCDD